MPKVLSTLHPSVPAIMLWALLSSSPTVGRPVANDETPMLWESSWEILDFKSFDPVLASEPGLTKQTQVYCARPHRPKIGKTVEDGVTCHTTRLIQHGGRYERNRRCIGNQAMELVSKIRGLDDGRSYDLIQETTHYLPHGKKISFSRTREIGRIIGECPAGFAVAK